MDNRQRSLQARTAAVVGGLTAVSLACIAYLHVHVPIASPIVPAADARQHLAWVIEIAAAVGTVAVLAATAGVALRRRRTLTVGPALRPTWLDPAPRLVLQAAVGISYAFLLTTAVLGLPVWALIAMFILPWLVVLIAATAWYSARFGFLALFAGVVLFQLVTVGERAAQLIQLFVTDGNGAVARGVFGQVNPELTNAAMTLLVWLGVCALVARFGRNRWLWVALAIATIGTIDSVYTAWLFLADRAYWSAGGINGLFATGGFLGGVLFRPYFQALLAVLEEAALVLGFALEAIHSPAVPVFAWPAIRTRVPGRLVAAASIVIVALPTIVITGAAFNVGVNKLCSDVASQVGLDFSDPYGSTLATDPMGRLYQRNLGQGAAVGDYTGDGFLDVYLLGQQGMPSRLYRNVPAPGGGRRFIDVTDQAGLGEQRGLGRVAFFADLNGTGRPDLVVLNDYAPGTGLEPSKIFRNNGDGTFTDVTEGSGFDPVGYVVGGASLADFFGDGRLDIYVSYWTMDLGAESPFHRIQGLFPGHNLLFRNLGNYRFEDVTNQVGLTGLTRDSFTSVFADFRQTGRLDLFQAVDHRTNVMYENTGGALKDVSDSAGVARRGNNMGVAAASLYGDGLIDLYTTDISDPTGDYGTTQGNGLFVAQRAGDGSVLYTNQAASRGVVDTGWGWGAAFVDMRLLGRLDLFAAQGMREMLGLDNPLYYGRSRLFLNDGSNHFLDAPGSGCDVLGDQRAVIPFDYNRDGAPDLLVTQVNGPVQLLENQTRGQHWLTVDLSHAGPEAAGAEVSVTVAGHTTTQLVVLGGSYLAGPPLESYFGLGSATMADSVSVRWANGGETVARDVAGNQVLKVKRM